MDARAGLPLAELEQLTRHLDLLHEELIDFENSLLRRRKDIPERVVELVKSEIDCEKSLLIICSYLNRRIEQCLRTRDADCPQAELPAPWDADAKDRLPPLSLTSQTQSMLHRSAEERRREAAAEAEAEQSSQQSFFPGRRARGPYRRYTESDKRKAINTALRLGSQNKAAEVLGLPIKNLKRWIKNGPIRRKGGRRTQDPTMESRLIAWIEGFKRQSGAFPPSREVRAKAIAFSAHNAHFKASKGWFEKFMVRHYADELQADWPARLPGADDASHCEEVARGDDSELIFR